MGLHIEVLIENDKGFGISAQDWHSKKMEGLMTA